MTAIYHNREGFFACDDETGASTGYYQDRDELRRDIARDEAEFQLVNDPPAHKPQQFEDRDETRQRVLVDGMKCLAGQLDLFE